MPNAIFELIFDHLFDAYVDLGYPPDEALKRSAERIRKLRLEFDRLVDAPYIGPLRPDIHSGIRILRRDKMAI
jgi:plasmid stabilization system protein ParE